MRGVTMIHPGSPCRGGDKRAPAAFSVAALVLGLVLSACSSGSPSASPGANGTGSVVAAENFWGSIAAQVGGPHVTVKSIITNPNTDPHAYEATAQDGRTVATAQLVIEN